MKTVGATLKTHLASEVTTLCTCWVLTRRDGMAFYFTDHDVDLVVGADTYISAVGYTRTAMSANVDMQVDNVDLQGIFDDDTITEIDLRSGLFDGASVHVFLVNWADLTQGVMKLKRGFLGDVSMTPSGIFQAQLNGFGQLLLQTVGDLYTPTCRADLGDTKCGIDLVGAGWQVSATVLSVTDPQTFVISVTEPRAGNDTWFVDGVIVWSTGNNAGRAMEVKNWTGATGTVKLFIPMPKDVQAGDTLEIYPGCDKKFPTCRDKFSNAINFRGEPYVPGVDAILQTPVTS